MYEGRRLMRMGGGMPEESPQLDSFGALPPMSRFDMTRQKLGGGMRPVGNMRMQPPGMQRMPMMPPSPEQDMFAMPRRPRPELMDILAGRI